MSNIYNNYYRNMIGSLNLPLCQSHPKLLISTVLSEHIAGIRFPSLHIYSVTTGICSDVLFLGLSSGLFCWNSSYFDFLPSKPITSAHFAPSQVSKPWLYALIFPVLRDRLDSPSCLCCFLSGSSDEAQVPAAPATDLSNSLLSIMSSITKRSRVIHQFCLPSTI